MRLMLVADVRRARLGGSLRRAFQTIGAEPLVFDYRAETVSAFPWVRGHLSARLLHRLSAAVMNRKLRSVVVRRAPDVVLVLKGPSIVPTTLELIRRVSGPLLVNYNPDNLYYQGRHLGHCMRCVPLYDLYVTFGYFLEALLHEAGARRVERVPLAHDPELHRPVVASPGERAVLASRVTFVGKNVAERRRWLAPLAEADCGLALWGTRWELLPRRSQLREHVRGGVLLGEELAKVYGAADIVLNIVIAHQGCAHNMRTFEIPACRGFMLASRTSEQLEFFEEGREIATFVDTEEMVDKVRHYLRNDVERARIAAAGHARVKQHTYVQRASELLRLCRGMM